MVQAQRGWSKACYYLWGKLLTLSPLYYVFLLQVRYPYPYPYPLPLTPTPTPTPYPYP